ncbi:hypothetical protein ACOQFB_01000 [Anaeromyxobacter sp. Red801]|uniref:hypothetical protein n=1 Tax=Anaeromyxobacter sp. Red801 TaxID=3411632 RepID=UPI003BA1156A
MPTVPPPKTKGRPPEGRLKVMISLDPGQVDALRSEAFKRAEGGRRLRPDVSALVREIVGSWMKRRGR